MVRGRPGARSAGPVQGWGACRGPFEGRGGQGCPGGALSSSRRTLPADLRPVPRSLLPPRGGLRRLPGPALPLALRDRPPARAAPAPVRGHLPLLHGPGLPAAPVAEAVGLHLVPVRRPAIQSRGMDGVEPASSSGRAGPSSCGKKTDGGGVSPRRDLTARRRPGQERSWAVSMPASMRPHPAMPRRSRTSPRRIQPATAANTASRLRMTAAWTGGAWRWATTWRV